MTYTNLGVHPMTQSERDNQERFEPISETDLGSLDSIDLFWLKTFRGGYGYQSLIPVSVAKVGERDQDDVGEMRVSVRVSYAKRARTVLLKNLRKRVV